MPCLHTREQSLMAGENIRIQDRLYDFWTPHVIRSTIDDAQFLQIGVSMAKLKPLLNHCKFFINAFFVQVFIMHWTADFCMRHYAGFLQIGSYLLIVPILSHTNTLNPFCV